MSGEILAFGDYRTNADLIGAARDLGYLEDGWAILDPTYGLGRFWNDWEPKALVRTDIDPTRSPDSFPAGVDFTKLPFLECTFDAVVFDPPYKLNGTGGGEGPASSDADYGVADRWGKGIEGRHELIKAGIDECARVLRPRGYLLVKCQDQVASGRVWWQRRIFAEHAEDKHGMTLVDELHLPGHRAQPQRWVDCPSCNGTCGDHANGDPCGTCGGVGKVAARQRHARRNFSTMLVLRAPR